MSPTLTPTVAMIFFYPKSQMSKTDV